MKKFVPVISKQRAEDITKEVAAWLRSPQDGDPDKDVQQFLMKYKNPVEISVLLYVLASVARHPEVVNE